MENNKSNKTELPENAYRELNEGEEYKPILPANEKFPEVTPWSVGWGLLMAVIFSAAAAYSGLKIGQVFEAAIPISIIAVGVSTFFKKKNALSQNVIIQSIGAASGVIVAGAIFTIPGLYILQAKKLLLIKQLRNISKNGVLQYHLKMETLLKILLKLFVQHSTK